MTDPSSLSGSFGSTSLSLIERAQAQEPDAWDRLLKLYSPLVYFWCRRGPLRDEDAADVLQEVFRAVSTALGDFRHFGPGSFVGWLRTITGNKLRDHYRRAQRQPEATGGSDGRLQLLNIPDDLGDDWDAPTQPEEKTLLLERGLELVRAEFEEPTWQAFWRVTIDGQAPAHAAQSLGLSINSVYKAKSRVLNRLRQELAGFF